MIKRYICIYSTMCLKHGISQSRPAWYWLHFLQKLLMKISYESQVPKNEWHFVIDPKPLRRRPLHWERWDGIPPQRQHFRKDFLQTPSPTAAPRDSISGNFWLEQLVVLEKIQNVPKLEWYHNFLKMLIYEVKQFSSWKKSENLICRVASPPEAPARNVFLTKLLETCMSRCRSIFWRENI